MSLPVFFADDISGDEVTLSGDEGRHAVTVKRIEPGERLKLIDGTGSFVEATVTSVEGKDRLRAYVDLRGETRQPRPRVTIVQALPKSERSELAIDLATQAGADAIIPWQADRCVAKWKDKHGDKWRAAALSATKQSRRSRVPAIGEVVTTAQLEQLLEEKTAYVLHEDAVASVKDVDLDVDELFLIVGPEGGIGSVELERIGATSIKLGPEVYRTASAAMVALSAIGALTNRW